MKLTDMRGEKPLKDSVLQWLRFRAAEEEPVVSSQKAQGIRRE